MAAGKVLALMRNAPLALSSYPSIQMRMTIAVSAGGHSISIGADGLSSSDGHVSTLTEQLPNGAGELHLLVIGTTSYAEVSPTHYAETGGRKWAALSVAGLSTSQVSPGNASGYLQMLAGVNGKIEDRGASEIDGAEVEHYRVTVDLQDALARVPSQLRSPGSAQAIAALGINSLPMDVWLDGTGFPRQVKFHVSIPGGSGTFTMRFRGSNSPVHVVAPPASQVYPVRSITELIPLIGP